MTTWSPVTAARTLLRGIWAMRPPWRTCVVLLALVNLAGLRFLDRPEAPVALAVFAVSAGAMVALTGLVRFTRVSPTPPGCPGSRTCGPASTRFPPIRSTGSGPSAE